VSATLQVCLPVFAMAEHGRRLKFCHINSPMRLMALPWQASLHKLTVAVGKKTAMPLCHDGTMTLLFNNTDAYQLSRVL